MPKVDEAYSYYEITKVAITGARVASVYFSYGSELISFSSDIPIAEVHARVKLFIEEKLGRKKNKLEEIVNEFEVPAMVLKQDDDDFELNIEY